jgi:hypothetical protein
MFRLIIRTYCIVLQFELFKNSCLGKKINKAGIITLLKKILILKYYLMEILNWNSVYLYLHFKPYKYPIILNINSIRSPSINLTFKTQELDERWTYFNNHLKSKSPLTDQLVQGQHQYAYHQYCLIKKIGPTQYLCSDTRIFLNSETRQGNIDFSLYQKNILNYH